MDKIVRKSFYGFDRSNTKKFLEDMSDEGYILYKIKLWKYYFKQKENENRIIYEHDYLILKKLDEEEYLSYVSDWTFVAKEGPYYWFYIEDVGQEIINPFFINNEQKTDFYKRKLKFVSVIFAFLLLTLVNPILQIMFNPSSAVKYIWYTLPLTVGVLCIYAFSVVKFSKLYLKTKKNITE